MVHVHHSMFAHFSCERSKFGTHTQIDKAHDDSDERSIAFVKEGERVCACALISSSLSHSLSRTRTISLCTTKFPVER